MYLTEYVDPVVIAENVNKGYIDVRHHKELPLTIWCYSRKATYDHEWNEATKKLRGLITHSISGKIIARPFEKFFNLNQEGMPEYSRDSLAGRCKSPYVMEKLDGSMGTIWRWDGHAGVATKGSFHSEQAEWATSILHMYDLTAFTNAYTPVVEIINQSIQHHVVHYEPYEDNRLVLIGLVDTNSGHELSPHYIRQAGKWSGMSVPDVLEHHSDMLKDRPNKEGYVMTFPNIDGPPLKVKVKHDEFLRIQKIMHHTSPQVIFEALRDGDHQTFTDVARHGGDFLANQVKEWINLLMEEHDRIVNLAKIAVAHSLLHATTRKEFAQRIKHLEVAPVAFAILDEKDYKKVAWKLTEKIVRGIKYTEVEED